MNDQNCMFEILFYIRYANHKDEKACVWGRGRIFVDMSARCFLTPSFGELVKNLHYQRTRSLKPWPPPLAVADIAILGKLFFTCINIYVFKDDFEAKKKFGRKGKISIYKKNIGIFCFCFRTF